MLLYLVSLIISLFTLILTLICAFSSSDSLILQLFDVKEISVCLSISVILLILGIMTDKKDYDVDN